MNNLDKLFSAKKIAIFGWPATGKSTLGKALSDKLNINLYSLDNIRWKYSKNGVKDDKKFLDDYNKILHKREWIIEGNALDFIDSRLEQADILIFFDSTVKDCINNFLKREARVNSNLEVRIAFDADVNVNGTVDWIKNRYSKKIEKLRLTIMNYYEKLIVIYNYNELDELIKTINKKA